MTLQTLYDQLLELRLPAFRQALQEQQSNPKFTELVFEERLALLVDHECTQPHPAQHPCRRLPSFCQFRRSRSFPSPRFGTTHHFGTRTM